MELFIKWIYVIIWMLVIDLELAEMVMASVSVASQTLTMAVAIMLQKIPAAHNGYRHHTTKNPRSSQWLAPSCCKKSPQLTMVIAIILQKIPAAHNG